jgi:hypothetical protein
MVEAPAGCTFDFLTEARMCPSSMLRETKTSEVTQAADQDGPKIERQNFEDEILH